MSRLNDQLDHNSVDWAVKLKLKTNRPKRTLLTQSDTAASDQCLHCLPVLWQFLDTSEGSKMDVQILGNIW